MLSAKNKLRILIIGNPELHHVGNHFVSAAKNLSLDSEIIDARCGYEGNFLSMKWNWWVRNRFPTNMRNFNSKLLEQCAAFKPELVLSTGSSPVEYRTLEKLRKNEIKTAIFLTDDPWNPVLKSKWLLESIPKYDLVYSSRTANLGDLKKLGVANPVYLPFAFNPLIHFSEEPLNKTDLSHYESDVMFAGGADRDRIPILQCISNLGVKLRLYGNYWGRVSSLRKFDGGILDAGQLRKAVRGAKIVLNLVRRANRDGSVMRTFEIPAMKACMLTEWTEEHQLILKDSVPYFRDTNELIIQIKHLLTAPNERVRFAESAFDTIHSGGNTYADRLSVIIKQAMVSD